MSLELDQSGAPVGSDLPRLSTQPLAVGPAPRRSSPWTTIRRTWRQLTSMRTALLLLVLLALAAIPGSFIPQRSLAPSQVDRYYTKHPTLAPILNRFSLFDVFHAPWFAAIYALLFISLIGCLIPRIRLHSRALLRKPPASPRNLSRLPQSGRWETALCADDAVAAAAGSLRSKRFRVATDGGSLSAEKGYLRETGNLLFHVALVFLLLGIGLGSTLGYQGTILLVDGHTFTNVAALYDTYKPGALTQPSDLSPFQVALHSFDATYQADAQPATFTAHVTTTTAGGVATNRNLTVNHPVTFGHARVYLIGHGYAIHVILRDKTGAVWFDDTVPCIPQELVYYLSQCVVKAPDTGAMQKVTLTDPQTGQKAVVEKPLEFGFLINFVPTASFNSQLGIISTFPAPNNPRAVIGAFTGDLGVDAGIPQSVYSLDTTNLTVLPLAAKDSVVTPGPNATIPLTQGFTLQVAGYSQWASLQVKDDPAKGYTLIAAILIILGLLLSLRVRRRRVWLRATEAGPGRTLVQVGGLARTDADDFAREFPRLVARLAGVVPPRRVTATQVQLEALTNGSTMPDNTTRDSTTRDSTTQDSTSSTTTGPPGTDPPGGDPPGGTPPEDGPPGAAPPS